jgi:hypothetical protein
MAYGGCLLVTPTGCLVVSLPFIRTESERPEGSEEDEVGCFIL